jgi:uncharacterized protein YbjT (DUF2867 family)
MLAPVGGLVIGREVHAVAPNADILVSRDAEVCQVRRATQSSVEAMRLGLLGASTLILTPIQSRRDKFLQR